MDINKIKKMINEVLGKRTEVLFGYLHGSVFSSKEPHDIDIAIFINPEDYERLHNSGEISIGFAIPVEMELEEKISMKIDLQLLNDAPLRFKYMVISNGEVVIDNESDIRIDFESISRVEYFDFRPKREEYLKEVFSL